MARRLSKLFFFSLTRLEHVLCVQEDAKRKAAYRKKAEETQNALDMSSLLLAAAAQEGEGRTAKDKEARAAAAEGAATGKDRELFREQEGQREARVVGEEGAGARAEEGRWWEQVAPGLLLLCDALDCCVMLLTVV